MPQRRKPLKLPLDNARHRAISGSRTGQEAFELPFT